MRCTVVTRKGVTPAGFACCRCKSRLSEKCKLLQGVTETMNLSGTYVITPDIDALEEKYMSELGTRLWTGPLSQLYHA